MLCYFISTEETKSFLYNFQAMYKSVFHDFDVIKLHYSLFHNV